MNKKIDEFIKLCETQHTSYFDGSGYVTEYYFDKRKFAELIVRECGNYADWYQENYTDADIGKAIKRYFGVK
jgi:hypothetical protein